MRIGRLPAGLEDGGVEIYIYKGELRALYKGKTMAYDKLPLIIRSKFCRRLFKDFTACLSLQNDFLLTDPKEMLNMWLRCNFGAFSNNRDMDYDGSIHPHAYDCGNRGKCPGEGKVCSYPSGQNGTLAKCEAHVYFMHIKGKVNKEIADELNISESTVETHLQRIRLKLGCNNCREVMKFAYAYII
jgi:DNA-binding CsgD family transcriptional regulator